MLSFGVTVMPDPPSARFVELIRLAEANGFEYGGAFDSQVMAPDPYPLLTLAAEQTSRLKLGLCVTTMMREPTVTAGAHATLQGLSGGRRSLAIGRGDSAVRMIGMPPARIADFERALVMVKELMNGRPTTWNGKEIELVWGKGQPEIPLYVAAYGPKALGVAGRVADGVFIQLADPDLVHWLVGHVRRAAEEVGRDPDALKVIVCAPAYVSDDLEAARAQTRWFPALVSNHVVDLLRRYDKAELPPSLVEFVERREFYDYREHARIGAKHSEFVDDETCDRLSVLGTPEQHVAKLRLLEEVGADQFNIYLVGGDPERTIETYGREIAPRLAGAAA